MKTALTSRLTRLRTAYRYATNTLTDDDAQNLILECEPIAGWFSLVTLDVQDAINRAKDNYPDRPGLISNMHAICSQYARDWDDGCCTIHDALEKAVDLALQHDKRHSDP